MKTLNHIVSFGLNVFDVFVLTITAMALATAITEYTKMFSDGIITISEPRESSYEMNFLIVLIFARITYVMLNHMGIISRLNEMLKFFIIKVKPR